MTDQPHFQRAEPPQAQGQAASNGTLGPFQSIRQLMSARRAFYKRIEEAKAHYSQALRDDNIAASSGTNSGGEDNQPAGKNGVARFVTPIDFAADDNTVVESSLQHDGNEAGGDALSVWKVNLFLRDEREDGIDRANGAAPFDQRFCGKQQPIAVTVVIKFNAANPDVEAPMFRIVSPRITGPSLFHGVVCANDLANGEWSLRRIFDVLLALRAHLIQHCAMEVGTKDGKFSEVEASDGATYIATLHPEWKLQSDVPPEALAKVRELVEAAATNSNQAAYLAQELQQREMQLTRHMVTERRPYADRSPTLTSDHNIYDSETEAMVRHLRELALQRIDEAAAVAATGETLQRRACALFALGRYEEAYYQFRDVKMRYLPTSGNGEGNFSSAVCYELAHCSLKLGLARRALDEALSGIRHSPPGPFATVLHAIATAVAKEEEVELADVVLRARVAAHKAGGAGYHHTHHPSAASSSADSGPAGIVALRKDGSGNHKGGKDGDYDGKDGTSSPQPTAHHNTAAKHAQDVEAAMLEMQSTNLAVSTRSREAFTVLNQLLELSPHNPRVLGAMGFALAISGDALQAYRCIEVATSAAGLDPIGMAILDPPALTPAMQKVWAEHRSMICGWLQTSLLVGQITAAHMARRVAEGLPVDDLEDLERERRDRIIPHQRLHQTQGYDNRKRDDEADEAQSLRHTLTHGEVRTRAGRRRCADPHYAKAVDAAVTGHMFALAAAVRDLFSAMDASTLVYGAGRCEMAEAAQALQLTGLLNQYGPPPPYGSLIDLGHHHQCDMDHLIAGRRTILPQHIDSLLDRVTVERLRGELLGPALALELRGRTITDIIPYQPQQRYDSSEFRRLIAMAPAGSRQQYYMHVRNLALNRMIALLQPTLRAIARDKLTLDRQLQIWAITEGGDIAAAAEMMDRGLKDFLNPQRRFDDLNVDGPRWHRRRVVSEGGLSRHTIHPSRRELEPFYDMRVILLIANRVANSGDVQGAQALLREGASRLAAQGHSSCPSELPCGRCQARVALRHQMNMLASCAAAAKPHVKREGAPAAAVKPVTPLGRPNARESDGDADVDQHTTDHHNGQQHRRNTRQRRHHPSALTVKVAHETSSSSDRGAVQVRG
jgi:tetratricopeptide (TPR) repeat protein